MNTKGDTLVIATELPEILRPEKPAFVESNGNGYGGGRGRGGQGSGLEEEVVGVLGEKATLVSIAISIVMECQRKMPVVSRAFKINGPPFRT